MLNTVKRDALVLLHARSLIGFDTTARLGFHPNASAANTRPSERHPRRHCALLESRTKRCLYPSTRRRA